MGNRPAFHRFFSFTAFGITAVYLAISIAWIAMSGRLAVLMANTSDLPLARIELVKGLGFVLVTSILLYVLIQRSLNKHRENEYKIQRLNRVYAVLHNINGAILRINDANQLLEEACRIAAEHGLYQAAGVRLINKTTNDIEFVAGVGPAKEIAERMPITLSENDERNQGPTGLALREGCYAVVNQLDKDPRTAPFLHAVNGFNIQSVAAFPLVIDNETVGALTFYSRDINAFDSDEIALLEELAADTSLGLKYIEKDKELAYLSFHDVVTGLANRTVALDRIRQAISGYGYRRKGVKHVTAIIILSIENYRKITDTHGIAAADMLLGDIASHLCGSIREGDTAARLDAYDFGIILTDVASVGDLFNVVHKLLDSLPTVIATHGQELMPHYRAGIAVHPRDGNDPDELIRRAGLALTEACTREDPFRYFSKDLEDQTTREYALEKGLREAVKNNELQLYYQPIINIPDRSIVGFEALSRWQNSQFGQVPPGEFIPVAESTGLITRIGDWSIEQAAKQLKRWSENGIGNVYVSINISAYQLRNKNVAQHILDIINESGLGSMRENIVLEITESVLIEDSDLLIPELNILKAEGIKLYVDDFGTGYSSLSYLRQFPVDVVKIDREFINEITRSEEAMALVKGIIGMARGIGLQVIAEGVETEDQFNILKDLGCDLAQGYLFSKPVPPDVIALEYQELKV